MAVALFPEPASPELFVVGIGLGALGVGITFTIGVLELFDSGPDVPVVTSGLPIGGTGEFVIPEVTVIGHVPSGVNAGNVVDASPVDLDTIPDEPTPGPDDPGGVPEEPPP